MPTRYTDNLEGVSFKDFALKCSRNFIIMLDSINESELFIPNIYYKNALEEADNELFNFLSYADPKLKIIMNIDFLKKVQNYEKEIKSYNHLRKTYNDMLVKVYNWTPPTKDHKNLYDFMIKQIEISIDYDCNQNDIIKPEPEDFKDWKEKEIKDLRLNVDYYYKELEKEKERVKRKNKWLTQLRDSL